MATYSFTIAAANLPYWNPLRATIEAIGEEIANLMGYRMTRLRAVHAVGAVTLNVESTYGYPASGTLLVQNEKDPVTYAGIVQTPTGQQFTGCSPLEFAHAEEEEVIDWSRNMSQLDATRRALLVAYAEGADLNRIGRSNVVSRPRLMTDDDEYRRLVQVMAWMQKNTVYSLELLLAALFPLGGYTIYESLIEHPCEVFITLPNDIGTTELGRAFMTRRDDKTSSNVTTITVDKTPVTVISVNTQPVSQVLDMSVLPSAATPAWTYVEETAVVAEATYFSIVGNELQHVHPVGTDSGRYERTIVEIDTLFNRVEVAFKITAAATVGGYPWKLFIRDGEREYSLIWSDAAVALGQEDETLVSGAVAYTFTVGQWYRLKLERDGLWIHGFVDGVRVLSELAAGFGASVGTLASFGYTDQGNANDWTVRWDDARVYSKSTENYWNLPGTLGQLVGGSDILLDASNPFVAGDTDKIIFVNATNEENYGTWMGTYVAAGQLQLSGIPHTDGACSTLTPTTFLTARDRFTDMDIGKTFTIAAGANAGDHIITALNTARSVTCAASTFVTQTDVGWEFKPAFVNEGPGIAWELTNAGSNVAAVLTLRRNLPQALQPVRVRYSDVNSAQILSNETVVNTGGTLYYPFYLSGPDAWIKALIDDITAAGVIARFRNPY